MHWSEYVTACAKGRRQADLALLVGVDQSTISRWMKGKGSRPTAENAMALARVVGDSPISGLLAAGLLREDEVDGVIRVNDGLSSSGADALLIELGQRLGLHVSVRKERGAAG